LDWPELAARIPKLKVECVTETTKFTVMDLAERVKAPTLIIHAADDAVVPISQSKRFYEKLKVEKKFVEIERSGHVFDDYNVRRRIEAEVLDWIKKHL